MDVQKKACCARSTGWFLVGIVIAVAWGIGNYVNGLAVAEAFAIPGLIVFAFIGVVALAELDVPWFRRFSLCPRANGRKDREHIKTFVGNH